MTDPSSCPWGHLEPAAIRFCEERLCHWAVEPANTWSNVGYLIAGFFVLYCNYGQRRPELSLIGVVSCLVGIGSTIFHMTGTRVGEVLDVSAMYLISSLFMTFYMKRYFQWAATKLLLFYGVVSTSSIAFLIITDTNGIRLFASHLAVCAVFEFLTFRKFGRPSGANYKYLIWMVSAFAFSFVSWFLDIKQIVCDPNNHILGGHAVWHLSNATCMWSYFKHQQQFSNVDGSSNR